MNKTRDGTSTGVQTRGELVSRGPNIKILPSEFSPMFRFSRNSGSSHALLVLNLPLDNNASCYETAATEGGI